MANHRTPFHPNIPAPDMQYKSNFKAIKCRNVKDILEHANGIYSNGHSHISNGSIQSVHINTIMAESTGCEQSYLQLNTYQHEGGNLETGNVRQDVQFEGDISEGNMNKITIMKANRIKLDGNCATESAKQFYNNSTKMSKASNSEMVEHKINSAEFGNGVHVGTFHADIKQNVTGEWLTNFDNVVMDGNSLYVDHTVSMDNAPKLHVHPETEFKNSVDAKRRYVRASMLYKRDANGEWHAFEANGGEEEHDGLQQEGGEEGGEAEDDEDDMEGDEGFCADDG